MASFEGSGYLGRVIYNELNFIDLDDYQMICCYLQEVS